MASSTRLRRAFAPLSSSLDTSASPLQRQLQHGLSSRTFTTSRQCLARPGRGNTFIPQMPQMKTPAQKSMNVAIQEQKELAAMPDDVGFLPDTFVMPHSSRLPSLLSNPSGRYKLEYARLKQRAYDLFSTAVMKFLYVRDANRTHPLQRIPKLRTWFRFPRLNRAGIPAIAKGLYEEMYVAFAKGNVDGLRPKLCENIFESLKGRVAARPANTSVRWTLHRYLGSPKLVSHRYTPLMAGIKDKYKQSTLQQAVVRIRSMQSLQRLKKVRGADGKVREVLEEGSSTAQDGREVTEYFVIQRMMRKGKPGEWKIWGTTEEMTLERFEANERKKLGL